MTLGFSFRRRNGCWCTFSAPPVTLDPPPSWFHVGNDSSAYTPSVQVPNTSGKKALAMEAYARALRQLPTIIADNGGYDGSDLISSLRAAHAQGAKVRENDHLCRSFVRGPVVAVVRQPPPLSLLDCSMLLLCAK